jgi:hypothetical protein
VSSETPTPQRTDASTAAAFRTDRPPQPKAADSEGGMSGLQVTGVISGAVGLAGLGFGVGFGIAAKSDADVAHDYCKGNACTAQRGVQASREGSQYATVSTVAFIAGAALSALGITLLVVGGDSEREGAQASIAPYVAAGSVGSSLTGRF